MSRLTKEEFVAALKKMGIDVIVEERYHDRKNQCSYMYWESDDMLAILDPWQYQLDRIKALRAADKKREKHNKAVWARNGGLDELMHELPLPDWAK